MLKRINKWKRLTKEYHEIEYTQENIKGYYLIDIRTSMEYLEFHLNGSINIPLHQLRKKIEQIQPNKEKKILVYCQSGNRSKKAIRILEKMGYKNVYNLKGGIENI